MRKFIFKIKKSCHNFMTGKSGFSLVELIVVIAIMAVMAAVLAPALLGYVERSRAQKDSSAMGEVTNAIQLSLADQDVYDELLPYAVKGNFSCYADGDASTNTDANKTITKAPDYWLFTDEARKLDETPYKPAGSMRGATVTFKPNGSAEYILKAGVVNQIGDESTKKGTNGGAILEDCPELYNRLRSTVGDTIKVSSQTYRNSTYTIFISMGTTGGNQADKQDAIQVYGQYNGTNLPEVMTATGSASQDKGNAGSSGTSTPTKDPALNPSGTMPEGAYYGNMNTGTGEITWYTEMPNTVTYGDIYVYGDYAYSYDDTWNVFLYVDDLKNMLQIDAEATNRGQTTYGAILESINGQPITYMNSTFEECTSLTVAPEIPSSVTYMQFTFEDCISLTTAPKIPSSVTSMYSTFSGCTSLTTAPVIPNGVTSMSYTFKECTSLTSKPIIPSSVRTAEKDIFKGCGQFGY